MIPSRRQRYFRPNSPIHTSSPSEGGAQRAGGASRSSMNTVNMNVLDQGELVMDGGEPGDDHHQVAHEEIVDDDNSDMPLEHHHHHQMHHQQHLVHQQYDDRQSTYQVQSQSAQALRRTVGRPINAPTRANSGYVQNPMDMVQKLQSKSLYMPNSQQRAQTRISPTGARIVSFGGRKRENADQLPPGVKKMGNTRNNSGMVAAGIQQHRGMPKSLQPVKVVRLAPGGQRANPTAAELAIIEIENNIKTTIEDSKIDMQRVKDLQDSEFSQDEYHQMMGVLLVELERANAANTSLNQYYRDRQRHEKTIYEAREDAFQARIRQLETEMRKMRESIFVLHAGKFSEAGEQNHYRQEHLEQMMVGEPDQDQVVIEEQLNDKSDYAETDGAPAWIVEETVEQHNMQDYEQEDHHHEQQVVEEEEHVEKKSNILHDDDDEQDQFGAPGRADNQ
uniref:Uncharacterized protein n=1 Tax=Caenorhabditis japonica TaxID=281687 RepID=A0A8R1I4B8_CAEJA